MKRSVYYRGVPGKKYGIWNGMAKCFQFNICEDTPMLAEARLYQKIGDDARKYRFEPRMLPDSKPKPPGTVSEMLRRMMLRGRRAGIPLRAGTPVMDDAMRPSHVPVTFSISMLRRYVLPLPFGP